jgi:hypothetical protein
LACTISRFEFRHTVETFTLSYLYLGGNVKKTIGFLFAALALFLCAPQAKAISICDGTPHNLVSNCGFESGDFASWTLSGNDVPGELGNLYGVEGTDPFGPDPHSGNFQAFFDDQFADPTTLSQNLTTIAGDYYTVSFYLAQVLVGPGTVHNSVLATFGGATAESLSNVGVQDYTLYTATVLATSGLTDFQIKLGNDVGQFQLDDVVVAAAAPEPSSWLLLLTGAGLAGWFCVSARKGLAFGRVS